MSELGLESEEQKLNTIWVTKFILLCANNHRMFKNVKRKIVTTTTSEMKLGDGRSVFA